MLGKALGLVTVADGTGPEFDIGELTTWLDDAVLLAPGMLLSAAVTWEATGADSFRVSVTDGGRTVGAEVLLDDGGRPRDFRSEDRYADLPGGPVRALWSTPVQGWTVVDGRPRVTGGTAVWHLPAGEFRYGELSLVDLALDVPPGDAVRPLLGLRHRPGRLARGVFRMPLKAYEHGVGPAAGRTFLAFTHTGRKTGQPHQAVAMVLRYDTASEEAVVCAAWGPQTDWYRNLQAHPATQVQLGGRTFVPEQRFLPEEEAVQVALDFRREHPHRLRLFSRVLGWGDLGEDDAVREFVRGHPFVAFRPTAVRPAATAAAGDDHPEG
jgi:deazaflavin-dependent oxidoreductase (nitroreductase family)